MAQKLVYGVGYNSKRTHPTFENGKRTTVYSAWRNMLQRCYSENYQSRNPTYIGCSVSSEWHDFQAFADWYSKNPHSGLGYVLDKDLLLSGNRVYSSEACCFVPQEINKLLLDRGNDRGKHPQGVYFQKASNKYMARLTVDGKGIYLGLFDCANKAYETYKIAKESHVKKVASDWSNRIDKGVFYALSRWSLD